MCVETVRAPSLLHLNSVHFEFIWFAATNVQVFGLNRAKFGDSIHKSQNKFGDSIQNIENQTLFQRGKIDTNRQSKFHLQHFKSLMPFG